ncbi:MAG: N-acetyl-gamma-glutamyl-phosphate reductase [Cyclobacteriaceae bacterium]|nr:N-acetyl-gamma-glutamyl-phosphate reductase [Cyclobacteriaceae bacterium]
MKTIRTAIVGGAGYTGGELIRLLIHHPICELVCIHSSSQKGKKISEVHSDLLGESDLVFSENLPVEHLDAVFLCLPHGEAVTFLTSYSLAPSTVVIDLSHDFRDESQGFTYGLPEVNKEKIKASKKIANPGCFATAIQLALAPALQQAWIKENVHVTGITGSTGAGKGLSETTHFSYRSGNISVYKVFVHQHLKEIKRTFRQLQDKASPEILFVPYRGNFTRGIWVTAYFPFTGTLSEALAAYHNFYQDAAFTHISAQEIHLKQVINTNNCVLHLQQEAGQLIIHAVLDNLLKGASGQAVQNFNLAFGLDEGMGLKLKSSVY